jgi:hypothetical protein
MLDLICGTLAHDLPLKLRRPGTRHTNAVIDDH